MKLIKFLLRKKSQKRSILESTGTNSGDSYSSNSSDMRILQNHSTNFSSSDADLCKNHGKIKSKSQPPIINIASILVNFTDEQYDILKHLDKSTVDNDLLNQHYDIASQESFCKQYLYQELIRFSTPEEDKSLIKVQECKFFLKNHSMKVSGNKDLLTQRISIAFPNYFGNRHYMLTDKGYQLLQNYRTMSKRPYTPSKLSLEQKLRKYEIQNNEFNNTKNLLSFSASDNDVIWGILNQRAITFSSICNYRLLRNTYLNMALLLEDEGNHEQSLEFFIVTICFDVNGCATSKRPCLIQWISDRVFYLRAYYNMHLPTAAYSKYCAEKRFITETAFTTMIECIISSPTRLSYKDCNELLSYYLKNI